MLLAHLRWNFSEGWMHTPYVIISVKQTTRSLCGNNFYLTKGVLKEDKLLKKDNGVSQNKVQILIQDCPTP